MRRRALNAYGAFLIGWYWGPWHDAWRYALRQAAVTGIAGAVLITALTVMAHH